MFEHAQNEQRGRAHDTDTPAKQSAAFHLLRIVGLNTLDFQLPPALEAAEPPEARGLARDDVRLMISYQADDRVVHTRFCALPGALGAGDVLVINTSGTMNAALMATRADGTALELHISTQLPADLWIVEARLPGEQSTLPFYDIVAGEIVAPAEAARLRGCTRPYGGPSRPARLWIATLQLPAPLPSYLAEHGFPSATAM